jgi:ABC-type Na+ efflux pump permease subunit
VSKILQVAWREFTATVVTKGFIIGVLITPAMMAVMIFVFPALINEKPPNIDGELALIDRTGQISAGVEAYLAPEAIARRWDDTLEEVMQEAPEAVRGLAKAAQAHPVADAAMQDALTTVPTIRVRSLPDLADVEDEKKLLHEGSVEAGGRMAIAVVHADAVEKAPGEDRYGKFDLFVRENLDDRIEDEIQAAIKDSIIAARVDAKGLDREEIEALTRVGRVRSTTVTDGGEQETNEALNFIRPMGFMILLLVSVMTSGQQIMTTTIEEKSSRVVEVLLSAVSPIQLMTGKIVGQMVVGFVILGLYAGMGIAALVSFALFGLVDPWLFFYLIIFYVIAYFIMGSLMAAIGAAVNELREAQTMMMPVMLTVMVPWLLWLPITRDPNSTFATVISFVPPINTFTMLLRMTSTNPPPLWQVWISILIGVASVYAALWFAAKVFRVGLLMFGKPPSFGTLIKWVRMA